MARQRRTGWRRLTPGYRAYLLRQGNTQQGWQSGAPIQRARSSASYDKLTPGYRDKLAHEGIGREEYSTGYTLSRPPPLSAAAVDAAAERVANAEERRQDIGLLRRWYNSKDIPAYLKDQPGLNKVATAATLSQIYAPPSEWAHVTFTPTRDPVWDVTVRFKDGSERVIRVPGYTVQDIRAWLAREQISNDIGGTP